MTILCKHGRLEPTDRPGVIHCIDCDATIQPLSSGVKLTQQERADLVDASICTAMECSDRVRGCALPRLLHRPSLDSAAAGARRCLTSARPDCWPAARET